MADDGHGRGGDTHQQQTGGKKMSAGRLRSLGEAALSERRYEEAARYYQQADLEPDMGRAANQYKLFKGRNRQRKLGEALRDLTWALELDDATFHHGDAVQGGGGANGTNAVLQNAAASAGVLKTEASIAMDAFVEYSFRDDRKDGEEGIPSQDDGEDGDGSGASQDDDPPPGNAPGESFRDSRGLDWGVKIRTMAAPRLRLLLPILSLRAVVEVLVGSCRRFAPSGVRISSVLL